MKIKLVGALPRVLKDYGFKPGQIWYAEPSLSGKYESVIIKISVDDEVCVATVYKENYVVV